MKESNDNEGMVIEGGGGGWTDEGTSWCEYSSGDDELVKSAVEAAWPCRVWKFESIGVWVPYSTRVQGLSLKATKQSIWPYEVLDLERERFSR